MRRICRHCTAEYEGSVILDLCPKCRRLFYDYNDSTEIRPINTSGVGHKKGLSVVKA